MYAPSISSLRRQEPQPALWEALSRSCPPSAATGPEAIAAPAGRQHGAASASRRCLSRPAGPATGGPRPSPCTVPALRGQPCARFPPPQSRNRGELPLLLGWLGGCKNGAGLPAPRSAPRPLGAVSPTPLPRPAGRNRIPRDAAGPGRAEPCRPGPPPAPDRNGLSSGRAGRRPGAAFASGFRGGRAGAVWLLLPAGAPARPGAGGHYAQARPVAQDGGGG